MYIIIQVNPPHENIMYVKVSCVQIIIILWCEPVWQDTNILFT